MSTEQQSSAQERTHEPTPRRRQEAAKKGMVLRSRELATMLVTLGGAATLALTGKGFVLALSEYFVSALRMAAAGPRVGDTAVVIGAMSLAQAEGLALIAPILAALVLLALAGPLLTGGIAFRLKPMMPKLENLDPLKGIQRMFGVRSLMELVKAVLKFALLLATAVVLFVWSAPTLFALGTLPLGEALERSARILLWSFLALSSALIVIAGIDLPFQIFQHRKRLRMTHQEVQDEMKETEGRPEVKRRQRSLQMEAVHRRLEATVPGATVVVTNPTHYSVALRYEEAMAAPEVVALGAGELALQIRRLAREHGVPVLSAPPLARALYFGSSEGRQIPAELYQAVAQVLVYVMHLDVRRGRARAALRPPVIRDEDIPPHLRRDEDPT